MGSQGSNSKEDQDACKIEKKQTQEMLECTKKEHESAVAQTYKFLCNLLTGDQQAQWGCNLIIVTPNPLTYLLMPLTTVGRWLYYSLTSKGPEG